MRAACIRALLPFGLLSGWSGTAFPAAALGVPEQSPAVFEHLTTADGLPQSTVYTTLQDSQGFVWLGTEDGLVRYDGHRLFRYGYRRSAAEGLPGNFIQALAEDAHHDLWIAVPDGGLARWQRDTDRFTVFHHGAGQSDSLASDIVVALLIDVDGLVWVGMSDAGIDVLDPRTGRIEHLRHDAMRAESLIDDRITTLARSPSGDIWVGTQGGLDRWVRGTRAFVHSPSIAARTPDSEPQAVLALYADAGGTLWEGLAGGGLVQRDTNGRILAQFRHEPGHHGSLSNDNVRAVLQDSDGRLWVGTEDGLDVLDRAAQQFRHYRHQDGDAGSLTDSYVMSLYQDANHLLWVGTRVGGVNRWNPRSWNFGSQRPAWLQGRMVTAFADSGDDRIWVASLGGGLVRFDPRTGQYEDIDHISGRPEALGDSRVMSLERDAAGTLWIGTMTSGLRRLSRDGRLEVVGGLSALGVMSLYAGRDGRLWIGTHGGGANVFNPRTGRLLQLPFEAADAGAVSSRNVTAFAEESGGTLWLATDGGGLDLANSAGQVLHVYRHVEGDAASLPSNAVYGLTIDRRGGVWVATDRGLARVLGSSAQPEAIRFETFGRAEGLAGDTVYGSLLDEAGHLWLSGNSGLTRFDPDAGTFRTYHIQHGLQGEEFDLGAFRRLQDGRLAFGGPGGFNLFAPASIEGASAVPRVALMSANVLGAPLPSPRPYWMLDHLEVDAGARIMTFELAALDFTSPAHNRLAYRLPNLSDRWIDLGTDHNVTLTNLDSGDHVLEVRAASADSDWSSPPLRITIRKHPPIWASGPAMVVYLGIALALAVAAWQARARRVAQARRIERLAYFDQLTGLPNRQRCLDSAVEMIACAKSLDEMVSFIYLDLDGFKRINDTFGHNVGDEVLRIVAERLSQMMGVFKMQDGEVVLSRFGGDEFVIIARHARASTAGLGVATACQAMLNKPISYQRLELLTIPSVGVAAFPEDGQDVETVLMHADTAMYHAKSTGTGGVAVYMPAMSSRLRKHVQLESRLRRAIQTEALTVEYQPKFLLADQRLIGAEVLTRWHDEELGSVSPAEFIPVAEESSLIIELGEWLIRAACRQLRAWRDEGIGLPIAINISGKELLHGHPARVLEQEARAVGIPTSLIEIEITESLLVRESATVRSALDRLRDLGCLIALDDFGTGYSSLAYITRFPPDKIKIDKAFVQNVDQAVADSAIAAAILSLGKSLRLTVTAEGIERRTQLEWLRDRGCHEGQGFFLSRPLTSLRLVEQFLKSHGSPLIREHIA